MEISTKKCNDISQTATVGNDETTPLTSQKKNSTSPSTTTKNLNPPKLEEATSPLIKGNKHDRNRTDEVSNLSNSDHYRK